LLTSSLSCSNSVCVIRRVNLLVYSFSFHRHSYIGFILSFASSIHNKQQYLSETSPTVSRHGSHERMETGSSSAAPLPAPLGSNQSGPVLRSTKREHVLELSIFTSREVCS
jgi:hypothetical protein